MKIYKPPITDNSLYRLHLNENLYGPSPNCLKQLKNITNEDLCKYDLTEYDELKELISQKNNVKESNITVHNGAADLLKMIMTSITKEGDGILLPSLCWSYYISLVEQHKLNCFYYDVVEKGEEFNFDFNNIDANLTNIKLIIITSPNMPTGNSITADKIKILAKKYSSALIVVDQVYYEFSNQTINIGEIISECDNVLFLRSFSKFYALANIRIGYSISNNKISNYLKKYEPLFKISILSRKLAIAAIKDNEYYMKIKKKVIQSREALRNYINENTPMTAFKSDANFIYICTGGFSANELKEHLKKFGFNTRVFSNDNYIRITIGEDEKMNAVIGALKDYVLHKNNK